MNEAKGFPIFTQSEHWAAEAEMPPFSILLIIFIMEKDKCLVYFNWHSCMKLEKLLPSSAVISYLFFMLLSLGSFTRL